MYLLQVGPGVRAVHGLITVQQVRNYARGEQQYPEIEGFWKMCFSFHVVDRSEILEWVLQFG